ncbi:MAG: HAD family hydrolase [Coprococcus sp.]|nr:HAD family hydrolase [Coprococcus sp.]
MGYQYLLFDLDGTIVESGPGIIHAVSYALDKMGKEVTDREGLRKFIGPPLTDSMKTYYGMTDEEAAQAILYYREYYANKGIFESSVYEGFLEAALRLKAAGKTLAVATSKPEEYAKQIAEKFEFTEVFEGIYGASMDGTRVKKEDVIHYALESLGIEGLDYEKVLMIGDRKHDILGAKANGLASMGVLYGYGSRTELKDAGADYIAETTKSMADHILAMGIE